MRIGAVLRLNAQPMCTAWVQGKLIETSLEKMPDYKGALVVLLPSTNILLSEATVPSRRRQQVIQALPYSLEEQVIEAPEKLHFALGEGKQNHYQVAVCQRDYLSQNLERLQQAGLDPDYILPDVLALPWQAESWSLLHIGGINLVRISNSQGFAIENNLLKFYLSQALSAQPAPTVINVYNTDINKLEDALTPIIAADIAIEQHSHPQAALGWFSQQLQQDPKTLQHSNLRQQSYQKYNPLAQFSKPWRVSFSLLLLWGILQLGLDYQALQAQLQQQQQLKQATIQLYKDTFPAAKNIIYPKEQMQQKLNALQSAGGEKQDFLALLHRFATGIKTIKQADMRYLDYRQQHLDIQLQLKNLSDLEQVKRVLRRQNLQVEIRQANSENGRVDSILRLSIPSTTTATKK